MELVSVIIPTYNRKEQLKKAVASVMMQTHDKFEIIIINDCSDYDVSELFSDSRIRIINNESHLHAGLSRKNGLLLSKGEYVIFMDDDDYYVDRFFLENVIKIFKMNNNISFVCAQADINFVFKEMIKTRKMNISGLVNGVDYLEKFQVEFDKPLSTFTTVFSKRKLVEAGVYDMHFLNDSVIYLRALISGDAFIMENVVGHYCIHKNNLTSKTSIDFMIDVFKEKYNLKKEFEKINIDFKNWWHKQYMVTMKYYIYGSRPSLKNMITLYTCTRKMGYTNTNIFINVIKSYLYMIFRGVAK